MSEEVQEYLSLDVGDRRIGVARANSIAKIAEPLAAIDVTTMDALTSILDLVAENQSSCIVVGYPRSMKGESTEQTEKIELFADKLKASSPVPVVFFDESATTKLAQDRQKEVMKDADEDSVAACIILEDYLNSREVYRHV